jgi:glutamyl-tRNA reductase
MKLLAVGVSHKTAPLEVREQLAVQATELVDVARTLKSHGELDETVLISTCNRVEIYGTTCRAIGNIKSLFRLLCSETADLTSHIYLYEGVAAARHLFGVTAGLDSMVLGETEITGQIKNAYEIARAAGLTGRVLNRLFQKSFQATKEIRTRTGIGRAAVSIKSAAVELTERILGDDFAGRSIMVIGVGQMAECCVRLLVKKGARSILVSNRSFDRAIDLAMRYGGEAVCFGYCLFEMREVDVVIAATSSEQPLLWRDDVKNLTQARRNRQLYLIDLSVPRNIDPAAGRLENVSLYNIDELKAIARQGVQARQRELAACHRIIDAHVATLIERLDLTDGCLIV